MLRVALHKPRLLAEAIRLAIIGYHYEKITRQQIMIDDFRELLAAERRTLKEMIGHAAAIGGTRVSEVQARLQESFARIRDYYHGIHEDFRSVADGAVQSFRASVESYLDQLAEPFRPQLPGLN